ncbi:hypothetical protein Tco_1293440 [Tanacetum coccineum]
MSNTITNLQTQTSNALRNAIMEAGGKDRPPMLAPGNYNPPYKFKWTEKTVPVAEGSSETTAEWYMENYKNVSQDIQDQLNAEAKAFTILKTILLTTLIIPQPDHNKLLPETEEKEIDKLMALISLSFKKIYKPTNNNLRTSSNTSRANQDNTLRINRGTGYDNQRTINVTGARENVGTQVVQ